MKHLLPGRMRPLMILLALTSVVAAILIIGGGRLRGDVRLDISRSGTNFKLTWTNPATLESAGALTGAWTTLTGAVSGLELAPTNPAGFFRLREDVVPPDIRYLAPTFTTGIGDPSGGCGCTSPENPNSLAAAGNPQDNGLGAVFLHTGEVTLHAVDLQIPGRGFDWKFERRYRSGMSYDGPLGQGWDFNYNARLVVQPNGDVLRVDGLGRADRYVFTGGGYQSPSGFYTRLARNPDGSFEERERHGTVHAYSATNSQGIAKLAAIRDRNGNQMTFGYNPLGQLTNVVDTLGRSIAYSYDGDGRLIQVKDFALRTLQFSYDGDGNLASETSPVVTNTPNGNNFLLGKTTRYTYSSGFALPRFNHNLLTVTAPKEVASTNGPPRLVAQYDTNPASSNADRVVSLFLGGTNATGVGAGGTITYGYTGLGSAPPNDFNTAVFQVTVTNRSGNVGQYRFNQLGNIVKRVQFTRGLRAGEPLGYTNLFEYNADGEVTRHILPVGNSIEYTFDSANPDRWQQGNLLQVRRLPGPRGGDQVQIVTSQTYETNFNFVATSTDARGNVTTYRHDQRGNTTNVIHRIPSIVEDFEYNAFGQMTAQVWPDNGSGHRRRDTLTYYGSVPQTGYLQSRVTDSGGFNLTTSYEYDAVGNVVRSIDPRGNDTLYTVNALNQVVREQSRAVDTTNGPVRYQRDTYYDANDNVMRIDVENRDETGALVLANPAFTTAYVYDILNNRLSMSQEVDAFSNVVTGYAYDPNQNQTLTSFGEATAGRQLDNVVQTLYDERDLPFRVSAAPGSSSQSTTQTDYDGNANPLRTAEGTEDAGGHATTYACDGYDRRVISTDAMGNVATSHYDPNGNVVSNRVDGELIDLPGSAANVRLSQTIRTYDAMDRRTRSDVAFFAAQTQAPIGDGFATTQWTYADNSQVTSRTDDNPGHTTTYTYDSAGRLKVATDAKGNSTTFTYNANSSVITTVEEDQSDLGNAAEDFTTRNAYDALERLVQTIDNLGNSQQYRYDSRGNRLLYTDARGNQTRYEFDGLSRLLKTSRDMNGNGVFTDPVDIITRQSWDDSSRVTSQTDPNTNTTTYTYDPMNRRIGTDYADCTTDSAAYDLHNNVTNTIDANGTRVSRNYDQNNRLTSQVVMSFGAGVSPSTTFENYQYDGLSRIVRAEDNDSIVTRGYDSLSSVTTEDQQIVGGPVGTITAAYDGERNQTRLVYPGGRAIVRSYDLLDRPSAVSDGASVGAPIATYAYLGPYRLEQRDYPKLNAAESTRFTPAYDGLRRTTNTTHTLIGGAAFDQRQYDLDSNNNKAHASLYHLTPTEDRFYDHDAANRLIQSWTAIGAAFLTNSYALDVAGNRTNVSGGTEPGRYTMDPTLCSPGDFQMNQYTVAPPTNSTPLFFDGFVYPDGNLAGQGTWSAHSAVGFFAVQVIGGKAQLAQGAGSREDLNAQFGTTMAAGQKFYAAFDLVNTGGNGTVYFAHFKDAGISNFAARVFITTNGLGDYTVGLSGSSPAVGATWPAGLTFGATYRIVTSYEFSTGNVQLWVNPANFFSLSISAIGSPNMAVSSYALRQATPFSGTSTQTIDNLCVSDSFANALNGSGTPALTRRQYDANGNLISTSRPESFSYDYRNRLVRFVDGHIATYRYDCFSRRIEKNVSGAVTRSYWDGMQEIEEQDSTNTTVATYVHSKGAASLLEMTRAGQQYYFHEDDLGSIVKVTDAHGVVVDQTEYADYGKSFTPGGPQTGNLRTVYDSDLDPNPYGAEEMADDFWFPAPIQITNIIWRGGYDYTNDIPAWDDFVIRIYESDPWTGFPGALVYSNYVGFSQVTRTVTGRSVCCAAIGQTPEFEYQPTFLSPISLQGNTRYWLSIVNNTYGAGSTWGWETSQDGNGLSSVRANSSAPWRAGSGDLAFQLVTDQTSSGNPFLYRACRFDAETGLTFAGRYLDPVTGRFTTRDLIGTSCDMRDLGDAYTFNGNRPTVRIDSLVLQGAQDPGSDEHELGHAASTTGSAQSPPPDLSQRPPDLRPPAPPADDNCPGARTTVQAYGRAGFYNIDTMDVDENVPSVGWAWVRLVHNSRLLENAKDDARKEGLKGCQAFCEPRKCPDKRYCKAFINGGDFEQKAQVAKGGRPVLNRAGGGLEAPSDPEEFAFVLRVDGRFECECGCRRTFWQRLIDQF